jgi:hypothetical protein
MSRQCFGDSCALVLCIFASGCVSPQMSPKDHESASSVQPITVVLTYKDYRDIDSFEEADYYLDGIEMGPGHEGFTNALRRLKSLPPKSSLVIWWDDYEKLGLNCWPPYSNWLAELVEVTNVGDFRFGEPRGPWTPTRAIRNPRYFTY